MDIGVQTFTIRKFQKKDLYKSIKKLIDMGFKSFELARINFNKENFLKGDNMKNKKVLLMGLALVGLTTLASCGGGTTPSTPSTNPSTKHSWSAHILH